MVRKMYGLVKVEFFSFQKGQEIIKNVTNAVRCQSDILIMKTIIQKRNFLKCALMK